MYVGNKEYLQSIGAVIRKERETRKWTQAELAKRSGVNRNYICLLENAKQNPTLIILKAIAKGLNMKISELLQKEEEYHN